MTKTTLFSRVLAALVMLAVAAVIFLPAMDGGRHMLFETIPTKIAHALGGE